MLVDSPPTAEHLANLMRGRKTVVVTGAGCSTESGIPDYRGPETRRRARNPMQYREFMKSAGARIRYWARSAVGWSRVSAARPNAGHRALAAMENAKVIEGVITQNVDRLHHEAGSRNLVELHGTLHRVRCMACGDLTARASMQRRLLALNPDIQEARAAFAPDGDADVADRYVKAFRVPECRRCAGTLKPDVVFFGESVPRALVSRAWALFGEAELLLVVGSSLAVFSGYRFVLEAEKRRLPVAILNLGPTRGDGRAQLKVEGKVGEVLPVLAESLGVG